MKVKTMALWAFFPNSTSSEVFFHFKGRSFWFFIKEVLFFSSIDNFEKAVTNPEVLNCVFRIFLKVLWGYYNIRAFIKIFVSIWTFSLLTPFIITPLALVNFSFGIIAARMVSRVVLNTWYKDLNVSFIPTFRVYGIRVFVAFLIFSFFQVGLWFENEIWAMEEDQSDKKLDVCKEKIEILQQSDEFKNLGKHHITNACFQMRKAADIQAQLDERVYSKNKILQMCWSKWDSISYISKSEIKFENGEFKPRPFYQSPHEQNCEQMVKIDQRNSWKLYEESLEKK